MLDASRKYATSPVSVEVLTLNQNILKRAKDFSYLFRQKQSAVENVLYPLLIGNITIQGSQLRFSIEESKHLFNVIK